MWFRYVIVAVFVIEMGVNFWVSTGRKLKETSTGQTIAGIVYAVLAVLTLALIK